MAKVKLKSTKSSGLCTDGILDRILEKNISIPQFFEIHDKFLNDKRVEGVSQRTIDDYIKHLKFFKTYLEGEKRLDTDHWCISKELFKEYLAYMVIEKQYKPCTVNLRVSTMKCYLNWLYTNGYTHENYSLVIKKVRNPEDTISPLTKEEVRKMLSAPDRNTYAGLRDFTIMILILDTAIRIQELCNTLITDIDFKNKILMVRGTVAKSRKFRELPLSKQSIILLKQLIEIATENNSDYIFMSSQTSKQLDYNVVIKNFEKYGKRTGISKRCTPHIFRHTYAVNAVRSGMSVFLLQKMMGHSTMMTTRKYIKLETEDLKDAHNKYSNLDLYL